MTARDQTEILQQPDLTAKGRPTQRRRCAGSPAKPLLLRAVRRATPKLAIAHKKWASLTAPVNALD